MSKQERGMLPVEKRLKDDIDAFIDEMPFKPRNYTEFISIAFERLKFDFRTNGIVALQKPEKMPERISA